jgi:hypothetical protein
VNRWRTAETSRARESEHGDDLHDRAVRLHPDRRARADDRRREQHGCQPDEGQQPAAREEQLARERELRADDEERRSPELLDREPAVAPNPVGEDAELERGERGGDEAQPADRAASFRERGPARAVAPTRNSAESRMCPSVSVSSPRSSATMATRAATTRRAAAPSQKIRTSRPRVTLSLAPSSSSTGSSR